MNKNILLLLGGFVAGTATGVFASMAYFKTKFESMAEVEIETLRNYYRGADYYVSDSESLDSEKRVVKDDTKEKDGCQISRVKKKDLDPIPYHKIYEKEENEKDDLLNEANAFHERNKDKLPKIISAEDANELPEFIDHQCLFYYTYDDTLADEEWNVIHEPFEVVGNCLDKYGFKDSDEAIIFIMNYALDVCYEINKIEGYAEPQIIQ